METSKTIFAVVIVILALLFNSVARGAETTLVIDLQKKIKADFNKMEQVNKEQDAKAEKLNEEIKEVVTKLMSTSEAAKKEELKNLYFKKRAEHLRAEAIKVAEIDSALSRITKNMTTLEREMDKFGGGSANAKGLAPSDVQFVKNTLKGSANIMATLQALKGNDPQLTNMSMTLTNLDMQYRTYFAPGKATSLKNQIAFMEDLHAYIYTVKSLLRHETVYLKSNVYYLMKDGIVRVINDFQKQFYSTTFKGFENQHTQDQEVLGEGSSVEPAAYPTNIDLKNIGNW